MFGNSHFDSVRQIFADQFTGDAEGYVYRKGQKGEPFRVSEAERDAFIASFNRRIRYSSWSILPATIILILALAWLIPDSDSVEANVAIWIGLGAILLPFLAVYQWSWNAPVRELQGRTPEGVPLTKYEARALVFSEITYGQLALGAAMGVGLVWKQSSETDVLHGWGVIWLLIGGGLILLSAVQIFRKWRFHQREVNDRYGGC